jgi:hypothetical protein
MSPALFLLLAALAAGATLLASLPGRPPFAFTWFVVGWIVGELAPFHLALQLAVPTPSTSTGRSVRSAHAVAGVSAWPAALLAGRPVQDHV